MGVLIMFYSCFVVESMFEWWFRRSLIDFDAYVYVVSIGPDKCSMWYDNVVLRGGTRMAFGWSEASSNGLWMSGGEFGQCSERLRFEW